MQEVDGISGAILRALAEGYDIELRLSRSGDGTPGQLKFPAPWARRFGMTDEQIEKLKLK